MHKFISSFFIGIGLLSAGCAQQNPKNIILCISDGCGYNQILSASFFKHGEAGKLSFESFPVSLAMSTYSADGERYDPQKAWSDFEYVLRKPTDSAASATAMATGFNTNNGMIGINPNGDTLTSIVDVAEELKKSTGIVTSVLFSHATPAAFVAKNGSRRNYEEIAREMILKSPVDVLMGCGHPYYDDSGQKAEANSFKYVGGESTWLFLNEHQAAGDADRDGMPDPWTLIERYDEFVNLMSGETPKRIIGFPHVFETLQQSREGDKYTAPYWTPMNDSIPTLAVMTRGALNVLDNNENGFFLMVEGGAIDWASHDNQPGRMIEEELDFANTIDSIISWVETHSSWDETLVIVTGDHETGYLTGPVPVAEKTDGTFKPIPVINNGKGELPEMQWNSHGHSNSLIPIFAKGAGSSRLTKFADETDPFRGKYLDNAELGKVLLDLWKFR